MLLKQNIDFILQKIDFKQKSLIIHKFVNSFLFFHSFSTGSYRKPSQTPLTGAASTG